MASGLFFDMNVAGIKVDIDVMTGCRCSVLFNGGEVMAGGNFALSVVVHGVRVNGGFDCFIFFHFS